MTIIQVTPTPQKKSTVISRLLTRIRADTATDATDGPFAKRRPQGTLKATIPWDPGSKKEGKAPALQSGAMLFYRNLVRLPTAQNPNRTKKRTGMQIYGAMAVAMSFPTMPQDKAPSREAHKRYRKFWGEHSTVWTARSLQDWTSVKKNDDSFSVKIPVFIGSEGVLNGMRDFYSSPNSRVTDWTVLQNGGGTDVVDPTAQFQLREGIYTADQIPKTGGGFDRYIPWLKAAKNGHIEVRKFSNVGAYVFMLCLDFTQQEATVMCQTPWLEIRPIDFYALMYTWASGRAGTTRGDPPIYSIPMSRIARELPPDAPNRLSKDLSILVDEKASYWWIDAKNNIASYESDMARHLQRKDGTLCATSGDITNDPVQAPPKSGLVFVDWVNLKMAFVNNEHRMEVIGLDRTVPANMTHYLKILNLKIGSDFGKSLISQIMMLATSVGFNLALWKDFNAFVIELVRSDAFSYANVHGKIQIDLLDDITIQELYNVRGQVPAAKELFDAIDVILSYAATSVENLYNQYAFRTVSHLIAYMKIIQTYAPNYEEVKGKDLERRQAYIDQDKLDPEYAPEATNYMRQPDAEGNGGRALMPHQVRNARRLAKSPNFAILAVDAGGGKTASCIFDFLKEMTKGNVRRGLIMCPSHLVAQYVKEFLYFTDSRVNVIAINTYTIRRHTLEGLARLLSKAPPNTVVITDYDIARGSTKSPTMGYGPVSTKYYPVVEMLRSFMFDYVFCDESHFLKGTSARQAAVSRLISDIPYKRLASGTLTPNLITDLLQQINLLDPTILPKADFLAKYALQMSGDRVTKWQPGYEMALMKELKENIVWCQTKRKEWAALLPELKESVKFVHMTAAQRSVYRTILDEVVSEIEKAMRGNKALRKLLTGVEDEEGGDDADSDDEDNGDEDTGTVDVDQLLRPYLARLEQFVVAPAADLLGNTMLHGEDRVSPKVDMIAEIIRDHINQNIPGKILIFTNFLKSAEAIYEQMPGDIKPYVIHYLAANKEADAARFERDPNKLVMVGVEASMNTGLNLQFCSRLIRVDSVWTPGSLEQGNSRIQRPNVKQAENRTNVFLDWVMCENSIDIPKQAYLLQKQVTVGKFEEAGNPKFERIELPPMFSMSLGVIRDHENSDSEALDPYFAAYKELKMANFREWADYRRNHPEDIDPATGTMKMQPLGRAPNQPGAALMYRVPYVPGTELYKAEDLGLVRYDAFMKLNEADLEDDEEGGEDENDSQRAISRAELEQVRGLAVHTEYGDGTIVGLSKKFLRVQLPSGDIVRVSKLASFMITRAQTNNADMRESLLRQIGDIEYTKPFEMSVKDPKQVLIPKKNATTADDRVAVFLRLRITNDCPGLEMDNAGANPQGAAALEALGFHQPSPYYFAEMPTAQHMLKQFKAWKEAGFTIHKSSNEACAALYKGLLRMRKNAATMVGQATLAELTNFYRIQHKPDPDRKMLYPYPIIEDDVIYLALPITGHPATLDGIRVKVPAVRWAAADVENMRIVVTRNLTQMDKGIQKMLRQGLVINNLDELHKRFKKLRVRYGDVLDQ